MSKDKLSFNEADLLGASNKNATINNERHAMLHNNSDEGNITISNERHNVLHVNSNEGSIEIANERHEVLLKNMMKEVHQS